jgi:hypothetical protein
MKQQVAIGILVLAALSPVSAQLVASHASTQTAMSSGLPAPAVDKPVARVNGAVLSNRDLLREEYTMFPYARQHNGEIPKEMEPQIRDGAMKMIIFEELVYQEAVRRKMIIPPAKMRNAETEFRKQFSSPAQFQEFLRVEFQGSQPALHAKIRRSLLIDSLLKTEVGSKSAVSLADLREYYNKNAKRFESPESFAFQTISFVPPEKATPQQLQEAGKRAQDTLPKAKAATTYDQFGTLAEKVSEDDYRVMMGEHKPVDRAKLAPQVVQALSNMKPGEVSNLIQVDQVYTIVRLIQHIPAGKAKFDDVKAQMRKELEKEKTNQVRTAFDHKLAKNAKIEVL